MPSLPAHLEKEYCMSWRTCLGAGLLLGLVACNVNPVSEELLSEDAAALSTPTGSMADARALFGGALLSGGKVLVVGGNNGLLNHPQRRVELYNISTGTWSAAAQLSVGRFGHSVTLLGDGRVFVSGGRNANSDPTLVHELYNPSTNTWSTVGSDVSRYLESAVLLSNGLVLRSGGLDTNTNNTNLAKLWSPSTLSSSATGSMVSPRYMHTLTRLQNGKVLAVGGYGVNFAPVATAEIYDPATGTWTSTVSMAVARNSHSATLLPSGKVLVVGGNSASGTTATAEIYDPASATWTAASSMSTVRNSHAAFLEDAGTVLVLGGYGSSGAVATAERFNPATGTWSATDPLVTARQRFFAVPIGSGKYLVAGGLDANSAYMSSAEIYSTVPSCQPTTCSAQGATCGSIPDGCGGTLQCGSCGSGMVCSASNTCVPACTPTTCAAQGATCGLLASGCGGTLQCGACSGTDLCTNNVCAAAPAGGQATYDATLKAPRCSGTDALCDSGTLLNGRGSMGPEVNTPNTLTNSCYDGSSGTYRSDGSLERLRVVSVDGGPLSAGKQVRVEATVWASSINPTGYRLALYYSEKASPPSWKALGTLTPAAVGGQQTLSVTYTLPAGPTQVVRGQFSPSTSTPSCTQPGGFQDTDDLVFSVNDAAPSVAITSPASGATVSGTVTLSASASDDMGVKAVYFYVGSRLLSVVTSPPYQISWSSAVEPNGPVTLRAVAEDNAGQMSEATVEIIADNEKVPPTVAITSPAEGATVSGVVTLSVSAADASGIRQVEYFVDSVSVGSSSSAPYSLSWVSMSAANGAKVITARATDMAYNSTVSAPVQVVLDNDKTPPQVSLTAPSAGATVQGSVTVSANATDDRGVTQVSFYTGTRLIGTDTTAPYSVVWSTVSEPTGSHSLTARAQDAAGNITTSAAVQVNVGQPGLPQAVYDSTRGAPTCALAGAGCDTGSLVNGRAFLGPEPNQPNTLRASACSDGTSGSYHSDESLDRLRIQTLDGTPLAAGKTVRVDATVWAWSSGGSDKLDLYYAANAASPTWTFIGTFTPPAGGAQTLSATYTLPAGSTVQAVRGVFRYGGSASPCGSGSYDDRDDLVFTLQ
jgi:hypothetical protein